MHHDGHNHGHPPRNYNKTFALGIALNTIYIVVEAVFGLLIGSLALLADAGHNLSDVLGLLVAWAAYYVAQWKPTRRRTYGWRSSTILAALTNAIILLVAVGGISWEAIRRLGTPTEIAGGTVIWVAGAGVVINTVTAILFLRGRKEDLNIQGAYLHMAADAGVSMGVVLGGLLILLFGWSWVDPIISLLVAMVILASTWALLRDSLNLTLHAVPPDIDPVAVEEYLKNLPGVVEIHDLHIWAMSTTETALTVHVVLSEIKSNNHFLTQTCAELQSRFKIAHPTIQCEYDHPNDSCPLASPDVV